MGDITLLLLLFAAFSVAWIEFLPKRFDAVPKLAVAVIIIGAGIHWLPNWYGWVVILLGLVDLVWTYHAFARDSQWPGPIILLTRAVRLTLAGIRGLGRFVIGLFARRKANAAPKEKIPLSKADKAARMRHWSSALALIVVSPIAAMPAILVFALVLVGLQVMTGHSLGPDEGLTGFIKDWLGWGFVTLGVALDFMFRRLWLSLPALIVAGSAGATFARKSGSYWRRFGLAALAIGSLYPVVFLLGYSLVWSDEPFFN